VTTQPAPEIAKQVILIVDDDEAVRESLRSLMKSEGFAVRAFSNGHDLQRGEPACDWVPCR